MMCLFRTRRWALGPIPAAFLLVAVLAGVGLYPWSGVGADGRVASPDRDARLRAAPAVVSSQDPGGDDPAQRLPECSDLREEQA